MGDRTWTSIMFSGRLNKEHAEDLVQQLKGQGCETEDNNTNLTIEDLLKPHEQFSDSECNYANMEGVEGFCTEHGVSYRKVWAAGGDYPAGFEVYNAVVGETWQVEGSDYPCVSIMDLGKYKEEGKTIEQIIAYLEQFTIQGWMERYPALELVE